MAEHKAAKAADDASAQEVSWSGLLSEVFLSPLNVVLASICIYLIYKIFFSRQHSRSTDVKREPELPPMKRRDMTPEEIRKYDGTGEDGRVLVAVNGKVFDVTRGRNFYGPGGPYHAFAGHDASRGLATFSVERPKEGYDDLSDLNPMEMESVREWEMQFTEKYHYVGRLLKPGEEPTDYSDEEEPSAIEPATKKDGDPSAAASGGDAKAHAD
ncbi:membrane-associated progesterone receptor component 1-like [Amblyomma americanum]|uniref:Putative steroid membrane receptor n=1 Tax=Amblyomma americanum TaxID=6943 RepID=A0A0C9SD70_AMBAM